MLCGNNILIGNYSDSPFLCGGGEGSWRGRKATFEGATFVLCTKGREELYGNHGECDSPILVWLRGGQEGERVLVKGGMEGWGGEEGWSGSKDGVGRRDGVGVEMGWGGGMEWE